MSPSSATAASSPGLRTRRASTSRSRRSRPASTPSPCESRARYTNYPPCASRLRISPGSHSAATSKGRQQISQSVVNRCEGTLVSMVSSKLCPQNGHWMFAETSITVNFADVGSCGCLSNQLLRLCFPRLRNGLTTWIPSKDWLPYLNRWRNLSHRHICCDYVTSQLRLPGAEASPSRMPKQPAGRVSSSLLLCQPQLASLVGLHPKQDRGALPGGIHLPLGLILIGAVHIN